jgi:hypothetical protein
MNIENTQVFGFEPALRAMRNPMDSWNKSDSYCTDYSFKLPNDKNSNIEHFTLGKNDMFLSQKLSKSGGEHRKHLRLISVWCDITLPRFIWQELDTYKHKENVSCSTMHKLMSYPITEEMFELGEDYIPDSVINSLNELVQKYKNTNINEEKKNYKYWAKTILPESFLQKRTMSINYETLLNIYNQRKNHELPQWNTICNWILKLPYFTELTGVSQ